MSPTNWALLATLLAASGGGLILAALALRRRVARARFASDRWTEFVDACPVAEADATDEVFPLSPPGPAGGVAVRPDGICLLLDQYTERTFWLPWRAIRGLDPDPDGGAMLRLGRGVEVHLTALASRAIWEAKARVNRPQAPAASAATAS